MVGLTTRALPLSSSVDVADSRSTQSELVGGVNRTVEAAHVSVWIR